MSGHSKWHSIKHKKAAADKKRGKAFTTLIKEITVAARMGGGEIDSNPRLRHAVDNARNANMPSDNIKKAIMRGTGELDGVVYEDYSYEGYGPGGVAIIVEALSDNKNRTVAEVRHVFDKYNGNLGENGCVSWMFSRRGLILIPSDLIGEDELMEIALDAGAEDLKTEEDTHEIITEYAEFDKVLNALKEKDLTPEFAKISMIPSNYIKVEGKDSEQMMVLLEKLEDLDDIQNVWTNCDFPDEE